MYLFRNMGSFETIFINDTNQAALYNMQPARNLPNILRSSNARVCKNYKTFILNNNNISLVSIAENANTSVDLNTTLSSVDSEKDEKYNKAASSPKSHHQRKQVHYPLDTRCDVPNWGNNNNKDTDMAQTVDNLNLPYVSSDHERDTLTKKTSGKQNGEGRRYSLKKSRRAATRKSGDKKTAELLDFDVRSAVTSDVNTTDEKVTVQSSAHNILGDENVFADIANVETKPGELPDVLYRNNDICDLEKKCSASCNNVISGKSTEHGSAKQQNAFQKDLLSYEFSAGEDGLDSNTRSNFLFASNVLCTCTCMNCTSSCDKDFAVYEDSVPSCDMETELFTPCVYDSYTSDYYHIFADMDGFDKKMFCYDEVEEMSVAKESACNDNNTSNCDAEKLIECNANAPTPVKQHETLKEPQILCAGEIQDVQVESYCTKQVTHSDESTRSSIAPDYKERTRNPEADSDLESVSVTTSNATFQNNVTTSTDVPVPVKKNYRPRKSKKGKSELCIRIQSVLVFTIFEYCFCFK